jgi:hypothetical protein
MSASPVLAAALFAAAAAIAPIASAEFTPVEWSSATTGAAAGVDVTLTNINEPSIDVVNLASPEFSGAPLTNAEDVIGYATGSDWTLTFSEPVDALRIYVVYWRGIAGGVDPVTYQFDAPFSVLSGLGFTTAENGDTRLVAPAEVYHYGILEFAGPLDHLTVDTNTGTSSQQAMTFALEVPEPEGAAFAAVAGLVALSRRRAKS